MEARGYSFINLIADLFRNFLPPILNLNRQEGFIMRKYIISVCLILSFCFFANAQTWNDDMIFARKLVDSLKNDLKNVKGAERVDCFNMLSSCYFWIWEEND